MNKESPLRNRVKELRARLGVRQADLAREVGITRQTIIAIEKGRLNPSVLICLKIARLLREPVDYVFYLAPGWDTAEGVAAEEEVPVRSSTRVRVPSKGKRKSVEGAEVTFEGDAIPTSSTPERYDRDRDTEADSVDETANEPVPESVTVPADGAEPEAKPDVPEPVQEERGPGREAEKQGQAIWDFF